MEACNIISLKSLPSGSPVTFRESSFFVRNGKAAVFLDTSTILAQSAAQSSSRQGHTKQLPVYFEQLGLAVKFGRAPRVNIAEGQCLWALRQKLPHLPVPEIYGWAKDDNFTYLFMELVSGITLENMWCSLTHPERDKICTQLQSMVNELRSLRQEPDRVFIGDINNGPLADVVFTNGNLPRAGPFTNVKEFHDWLSLMLRSRKEQHWPGVEPADIPDPYRQYLTDVCATVFTHADLHPSNILVSGEKPHHIVSIIDWQQSGWYPDYWEFCKAEYTAEPGSEWIKEYIPQFLKEPKNVEGFALYSSFYGY